MTIPFAVPSTALVEKKPRFLVSSGFSLVKSDPRDWGSDSPVKLELSTLKPRASTIRMSAGIRSPNFTFGRLVTVSQKLDCAYACGVSMKVIIIYYENYREWWPTSCLTLNVL